MKKLFLFSLSALSLVAVLSVSSSANAQCSPRDPRCSARPYDPAHRLDGRGDGRGDNRGGGWGRGCDPRDYRCNGGYRPTPPPYYPPSRPVPPPYYPPRNPPPYYPPHNPPPYYPPHNDVQVLSAPVRQSFQGYAVLPVDRILNLIWGHQGSQLESISVRATSSYGQGRAVLKINGYPVGYAQTVPGYMSEVRFYLNSWQRLGQDIRSVEVELSGSAFVVDEVRAELRW